MDNYVNRLCKTQKRGMENGFIHKIEKKDSIGYSQGQASENMRKMEGRCEKKEVIPWLSINYPQVIHTLGISGFPRVDDVGEVLDQERRSWVNTAFRIRINSFAYTGRKVFFI